MVVVGTVGVVQSLSSSGQSSTPSHQDVALMQMLLVGHRTVPDGQGLQMHPHEGVSSLCRPYNQNTFWLTLLYPFRHIHNPVECLSIHSYEWIAQEPLDGIFMKSNIGEFCKKFFSHLKFPVGASACNLIIFMEEKNVSIKSCREKCTKHSMSSTLSM